MDFLKYAGFALGMGPGFQVLGQVEAGKARKNEENLRASLEKIRAKRERVQQIRQARIQRAEILQQGANSGASESSSVQTGAAGTYAQAFSNIQYINTQEAIGRGLKESRQDAQDAAGLITLGKGIMDVAGMAFGNMQNINTIFQEPPIPDDVFVTPKVSSPYDTVP